MKELNRLFVSSVCPQHASRCGLFLLGNQRLAIFVRRIKY